jgi:hypothetical protein
MTARKISCSTKCPFRRYAKSYLKRVAGRLQPSAVRIHLPGLSSELRIRLRIQNKERSGKDRYWDTAGRQNTAGEGITKKNPGAGKQDREDKVFSLVAPQGESPKKIELSNPVPISYLSRYQDTRDNTVKQRPDRRVVSSGSLLHFSRWLFLAWLVLLPLWWRWHVPPKRRLTFNTLHGVMYS